MDYSKVLALCPALSHMDHRLQSALARAGIRTQPFYGCSDLPRVRSELLTHGLEKSDAEVFLLVDSDMTPTPDQLAAMLSAPLGPDNAVSAAYPTRDGKLAAIPVGAPDVGFELGQPGLVALTAAGLGLLAVHRASLERVALALPHVGEASAVASGRGWRPFAVPYWEGHTYYADDYALCQRLRQHGVGLWLNTNVLVGHVIAEPRAILPGWFGKPKPEPVPEPVPVVLLEERRRKRGKKPARRR